MIHNPCKGIPFDNFYFDAVYSHMFFNMRFTDDQLKYLFVEVNRVLKTGGLNLLSVRSDNDVIYRNDAEVEKNINTNGFQIRFFTKSDVEDIPMTTRFTAYKLWKDVKNLQVYIAVFAIRQDNGMERN